VALALQQTEGGWPVVLGAYPQSAADPALLAAIGALCAEHQGQRAEHQGQRAEHQEQAAVGWSVQEPLQPTGQPGAAPLSVLLAFPPLAAGQSLCTLALIGDPAGWNAATHVTMRVLAAMVAAQIRHVNDITVLAERQALSSALIAGSPTPVLAANSDVQIVEFNPAAEKFFGRRREDVMGRQVTDLILPERDVARTEQAVASFLRDGDRGEFVGTIRAAFLRADGTEVMADMTPVPLIIDGEAHFCAFLRDLTEIERSEAASEASQTRFELLARLAPVGIALTDVQGRCTFVNDRWCVLTGTTAQEAIGASWAMSLHPGDVRRIEREWLRAAEHGAELRTDLRLRASGDQETWVHAGVVALPGPDGKPAGFLAALTNVSDRKRAEAERERLLAAERSARRSLAAQTERLNGLIAAAVFGVLSLAEDGKVAQVNKSFCDMFGIKQEPGELTGMPVAQLVHRLKLVFADPADFVRRTSEIMIRRQPVSGEQMTCTDGRSLACDYWPVFVDGDYRGDFWSVSDVSDRTALQEQRERTLQAELAARELAELAQQQLTEQNERLRELDDAKTQFIATVSHELRTPLTSIVSFTELLRGDEHGLTADTEAFLDIIERNAERLLHLVGDLLLLSWIEAGVIPLDLAPVDIPGLLQEVAISGSPGAAKRGIEIEVSAQEGPPIQGDQLRLHEVFDNLLSNAVKFSGQNSPVRITATHDGHRWRIEVENTGIGIPPDELGQVFARFVRATNARKASVPGTGLGLSVVKAITELHGGQVEAESTVGGKTIFRVYLPIRQ